MKRQIPGLNGLRAASITLVLLGHFKLQEFKSTAIPAPLSLFFDASFGVNVFFVISGFLITTLLMIEEEQFQAINLKSFYKRRVYRIFPAFYFLLLFYLILQIGGVINLTAKSWLSSIFFYKYIAGGDWETGHFWSLSVEEHFYLLWPFAFAYLSKYRIQFAILVILGVICLRFNAYYKFLDFRLLMSDVSIFMRADALMLGCLTAIFSKRITRIFKSLKPLFVSPIMILILISFFNSSYIIEWNIKYDLHLGALIIPLGIGTPFGLITNLLICVLIISSINSKGVWFNLLNHPVSNYLGRISYSLYLWQQIFFSAHLRPFSNFPINFLFIFTAAIFSYHLVETPFIKLKNRQNNLSRLGKPVLVNNLIQRQKSSAIRD